MPVVKTLSEKLAEHCTTEQVLDIRGISVRCGNFVFSSGTDLQRHKPLAPGEALKQNFAKHL